mmetsp:Transcript_80645/g.180423  ORF Transcript_80645/g.180423 Transcript_80645/m.180423 type:complete len:226 (-) Transcript_80645:20-697(-)
MFRLEPPIKMTMSSHRVQLRLTSDCNRMFNGFQYLTWELITNLMVGFTSRGGVGAATGGGFGFDFGFGFGDGGRGFGCGGGGGFGFGGGCCGGGGAGSRGAGGQGCDGLGTGARVATVSCGGFVIPASCVGSLATRSPGAGVADPRTGAPGAAGAGLGLNCTVVESLPRKKVPTNVSNSKKRQTMRLQAPATLEDPTSSCTASKSLLAANSCKSCSSPSRALACL